MGDVLKDVAADVRIQLSWSSYSLGLVRPSGWLVFIGYV